MLFIRRNAKCIPALGCDESAHSQVGSYCKAEPYTPRTRRLDRRLQYIPPARCSQEGRDHPCPKKDDYSYHLTLPRGGACYSLKILVYDQQSHHFHSLSKHNHSVDIRDTTTAEGSKRYWFHYYPSQCILWHCTEVVQTNWDPTTVMKTINLKNTL